MRGGQLDGLRKETRESEATNVGSWDFQSGARQNENAQCGEEKRGPDG